MEHIVIDGSLNGYPARVCNRCEGVVSVYSGGWIYAETTPGIHFEDTPCSAEETINDIMVRICKDHDYTLYEEKKSKFSKYEQLYLEEVLFSNQLTTRH